MLNNGQSGQISLLDAITIVSFLIGIANYDENVTQGVLQDVMSSAVEDLHSHLKKQDDKIDQILEQLKGGNTV
jgi:hypothetical protein